MTPKLMDRLVRLEGARDAQDGSGSLPPDLVRVWLRAVAIALGGYPCALQPTSSGHPDSFSDGFARALGYADRDDMEAGCLADLEDWHARVERANAVLCERYGAEQCSGPAERGHILLTAALDEWAAAKSSSPE